MASAPGAQLYQSTEFRLWPGFQLWRQQEGGARDRRSDRNRADFLSDAPPSPAGPHAKPHWQAPFAAFAADAFWELNLLVLSDVSQSDLNCRPDFTSSAIISAGEERVFGLH